MIWEGITCPLKLLLVFLMFEEVIIEGLVVSGDIGFGLPQDVLP